MFPAKCIMTFSAVVSTNFWTLARGKPCMSMLSCPMVILGGRLSKVNNTCCSGIMVNMTCFNPPSSLADKGPNPFTFLLCLKRRMLWLMSRAKTVSAPDSVMDRATTCCILFVKVPNHGESDINCGTSTSPYRSLCSLKIAATSPTL